LVSFSKLKKIFQKYSGRAIILIGIILILHTYREYYSQKQYFNFSSHSNYIKSVEESGTIEYTATSDVLDLENTYDVNETIEKKGSLIFISGDIDGTVDPVIETFMKNKFYSANIDVDDTSVICKEAFNPLYPILLRRLAFFMPRTVLYNGQKWTVLLCDGEFQCDYSLKMRKKIPEVSYFCSGIFQGFEVALTGEVFINSNYSGFLSLKNEITISTQEYVSKWFFKDKIKK